MKKSRRGHERLHNGHALLFKRAREITGADIIIVILSGAFVQRGAPALFSKYARSEAALACGADLIVEKRGAASGIMESTAFFLAAGKLSPVARASLSAIRYSCGSSQSSPERGNSPSNVPASLPKTKESAPRSKRRRSGERTGNFPLQIGKISQII